MCIFRISLGRVFQLADLLDLRFVPQQRRRICVGPAVAVLLATIF